MTEDFLFYLWKYRLIESIQYLASGDRVEIVEPGTQNKHAGPDFFNARIRIGDTLWAGNVEIHTHASHWFKHGHHCDKAYDNVIMHVVGVHDREVFRENGEPIPTLSLENKVDDSLLAVYRQMMQNRNWIPCSSLIPHVSRFVIHNWLDRMLAERFERKGKEIEEKLGRNQYDWNEAFYQCLARNYGFSVNAEPFEMLAKSTPLALLLKHKDSLFQLESLLFGQAGMLNTGLRGRYFLALKKEYEFLAKKYALQPLEPHLWQFLRMRPSNFPSLRIAQFAAHIHQSEFLFSKILEVTSFADLCAMFQVCASSAWDDRYTFKKRAPRKKKRIGKHAINLLLINTVIPFLYSYGRVKQKEALRIRALKFLEQIPGESNTIIKGWQRHGLPVRSAYNTQALLELKIKYCQRKRCLACGIGNSILSTVAGSKQP